MPTLVTQKVTIIFQCLLVNIFKALGNCPFPHEVPWHSFTDSTWICFFYYLVMLMRGNCVFVHTSPLATMLFVSLWKPLNSHDNDFIIKYTTNMPSHKSSMTAARCSASCLLFQAQFFLTRSQCYRNPMDVSLWLFFTIFFWEATRTT